MQSQAQQHQASHHAHSIHQQHQHQHQQQPYQSGMNSTNSNNNNNNNHHLHTYPSSNSYIMNSNNNSNSNNIRRVDAQQSEDSIGPTSSPSSTTTNEMRVVISRMEAHDVIVNFKRHLQEKWRKNKAKQHVNKIIHYHVQHTFFLRNAAPLFLADYQDLLTNNLAKEGLASSNVASTTTTTTMSANGSSNINSQLNSNNNSANLTANGREQGLIATLKQINTDVLNGKQKTKSIDVLESYLRKLEQREQLSEFLEVLTYIIFGETPPQIPAELNERKKNLFHYVSPIIAFLIIFYIHAEKKPATLDELVTRSGLKQLYKSVCKDAAGGPLHDNDDPNSMHDEQNHQAGSHSHRNGGRGAHGNADGRSNGDDSDSDASGMGDDLDEDENEIGGGGAAGHSKPESHFIGGQANNNTTKSHHHHHHHHSSNTTAIGANDDSTGTHSFGSGQSSSQVQSSSRNTQPFLDLERTISQQKHQLGIGMSNPAAAGVSVAAAAAAAAIGSGLSRSISAAPGGDRI